MVVNGNKIYKARKKYVKEGKKGDVEGDGGGNDKGDSNAVVERTREVYVT